MILKFLDHRVRNRGDFAAKLDDSLDTVGVLDVMDPVFHDAVNKNITGKQRFGHLLPAAPGCLFKMKSGKEKFETEISTQTCRRNMFMLRLCPNTKPSWNRSCHLKLAS